MVVNFVFRLRFFQFKSIFVGSVIADLLDQNDREIPLALYTPFQYNP